MGTVFSFDVRDARTPAVESALAEAVSWLHRVDEVFSTYRPDSAVSRLARGELGLDDCPAEVREVLGLCEQVGVPPGAGSVSPRTAVSTPPDWSRGGRSNVLCRS